MPAQAQLAQDEAATGHLASAISLLRGAVNRLPLPQYVVQLGETELAAGRTSQARRDLALVGIEERLLQANGVNTDVDLALFEASHGSPQRGVELARRAWSEAPSVRSADALGWALTRSGRPVAGLRWAHRALSLGSRDPNFLFHAGVAAFDAGTARSRVAISGSRWRRTRASRRSTGRGPASAGEGRAMRLRLVIGLLGMATWLLMASGADAHPLGNFSINHLSTVSVSRETVAVRYVLDQAEIPTFQERGLSSAAVIARKEAEVARRLMVTQDGRSVALSVVAAPVLSHPPGQAGLPLTRLVLELRGTISPGNSSIRVDDGTFPGRVGWKAVVIARGTGTAVRSSVPASDPTLSLCYYPGQHALDAARRARRDAQRRRGGSGSVSAPHGADSRSAGNARSAVRRWILRRSSPRPRPDTRRLLILLALAFAWGAAHALSPGHWQSDGGGVSGRINTRGRPRHALALAATVTVTHTAGVFALGFRDAGAELRGIPP